MKVALGRTFEFRLPLAWLFATPVGDDASPRKPQIPAATRLRLRFSLWHDRLPVDALPLEGWIELSLLSEESLASFA